MRARLSPQGQLLLPLLLLQLSLFYLGTTSAQGCSAAAPCEIGCCNSFGYCGFGPDYCDKTCVADCGRKSDCDPGHGKEWSKSQTCPLNVCCSKHGFCGTTKDFCGNTTVKRPSCSKTNGNSRVIGYYEGWATTRSCNAIYPEQIPTGVYSHINFAFATIDPKTFKVLPWGSADINLYKRLMLLKKKDPFLKIMVAIGGWAFNDPGPTRTTFSDLAASVSRQKAFIDSLTSFMATYGFDGVDLDWEYPRADDRGGRSVDFDNFPKFMARLKSALAATGGRNLLTITLPASFWYLQHFDLKALAKEVSWFNMMSYDLHGMWDFPNKWTGPFLNAHTNLTEIKDALDLMWRNDIKPEMVVLGLGFYGRAFRATSQSCLEPGCPFQEQPAERGKCSKEAGILLNSEIDQIVKERNIKPKLYKEEAVKVAAWANQWVAYDDEETLGMKSEFAQSQCLGGLMVWAISHDTADAKYSIALARVANRRGGPQAVTTGDSPTTTETVAIPQCKWMGCGQGCPAGWIHMKRTDDNRQNNDEYMLWDKGCEAPIGGSRPFCCPTDNPLPMCGWFTHHNGACEPGCPSGYVELGSTDAACRFGYQSACCKIQKSTDLYATCEWGPWPRCDELKQCPWKDSSKNTLLTSSILGLGGSLCDDGSPGRQQRKMCCNTKDGKKTWKKCGWHQELLENEEYFKFGFNTCKPTCPLDLVLVAQDRGEVNVDDDANNVSKCIAGGRAHCCEAGYSYEKIIVNPVLDEYRKAANKYLEAPSCPNPNLIFDKRRSITRRAVDQKGFDVTDQLLLVLLTNATTQVMLEAMGHVWDSTIGSRWPEYRMANLRPFAMSLPTWLTMGPIDISHKFLCTPDYWADRIKFWLGTAPPGTVLLDCSEMVCSVRGGDPRGDYACHDADNPSFTVQNKLLKRVLERRGSATDYKFSFTDPDTGRTTSLTVTRPEYYSAGPEIPEDSHLNDEVIDLVDPADCTETRVKTYALPTTRKMQTEHVIEGQMIPMFIIDAVHGALRTGRKPHSARALGEFFIHMTKINLPADKLPALPGGKLLIRGMDRIMECLGSKLNTANMHLLMESINNAKASVMSGEEPVEANKLQGLIDNNPAEAFKRVREVITAIHYMNYAGPPDVNARLGNIATDIYNEFIFLENYWNSLPENANRQVRVSAYWAEWITDHMEFAGNHARTFVRDALAAMAKSWTGSTDATKKQLLHMIPLLDAEWPNLLIMTGHLP